MVCVVMQERADPGRGGKAWLMEALFCPMEELGQDPGAH